MTNYEKIIQSKDSLINFLDLYGNFDGSPWMMWFNKTYCKKCEPIIGTVDFNDYPRDCEFAYCELHKNCQFFPEMSQAPDNKQIIKMWLEQEVEK